MNAHAACELLIQEIGGTPPAGGNVAECMQAVNLLRIDQQWPMVSHMSCFNPVIQPSTPGPLTIDLKPLRAFWEKGLTLVLKHDRHGGVSHMLAACKPLAELSGENILSQLARVMLDLLPLMGLTDVDVTVELAGRFDKLLRDADHLTDIIAEELLRDALFYLSLKKPDDFVSAWEWNERGETQLQSRLRWHAKQFSTLLYPTQDEDKIDKEMIIRNLFPITDALLFLGEIKLRTRFILRLDKIETRMLKIAVPVQVLMAEALRLAI